MSKPTLLANLANVEAVTRERLDQFVLFVREMREQCVSEDVGRPAELGEVARVGDEFDQRTIETLQDIVDNGVFFGKSVDDRFELLFARSQMGEHVGVLETMMHRDHSVIGGAVSADGPIVLSNCELIERVDGVNRRNDSGLDTFNETANLVELFTEMIVHGDEMRAHPSSHGAVRDIGW
jgi:hypothetical protein